MSYNQYDDRAIMAEKFEELLKEQITVFSDKGIGAPTPEQFLEMAMDCLNKASNQTEKPV